MKILVFNKLFLNLSVIVLLFILLLSPSIHAQQDSIGNSEVELFPILNYDSDAGFGYGGKGFLYNFLGGKESLDLTLYNSTKGERWYHFAFSIIDMQRRQGAEFPLALDLVLDYDKWIRYRYYSVEYFSQRDSLFEYETYTREPFEISVIFSRGFTEEFAVSAGLKFKTISSYNFNKKGELLKFNSYFNKRYINTVSFLTTIKWDTRNSFVNPDNGILVQLDAEYAPEFSFTNEDYFKLGFTFQNYNTFFIPKFVIASRIVGQIISPDNVPIQLQLPIGGNNTLRGLPQDRYLSASTLILNNEIRFPIWRRLGGVAGLDIGSTGSTTDYEFWSQKLSGWIINPVLGLRYNMDNFIVRFDVGFGKETTRIYFNFGHIF